MNKNPKFKVENVANLSGRYVIFAKRLNNLDFTLESETCLGGINVLNFQIPRIIDKNGKQRFDIFAFQIESLTDLKKFSVNDILELT